MSIGIVTSYTSNVSESNPSTRATIASSTTSYVPGRLAWAIASTITMIPSAAGPLLDPPSTSALANTNDTSAVGSLGATETGTRYPTESKAHKNYSQAPPAPLCQGGWSALYRHTHSGLKTKRDIV